MSTGTRITRTLGALLLGATLVLGSTAGTATAKGPAAKVNKEFSVVLRCDKGHQRSFRVCAAGRSQAVAGAKRAWGHRNDGAVRVVSVK